MADLPSGAITFLFSDIEGSTRLVKVLRERYAEVLADHQRLLREAFRSHRGIEVDTQGDSFFFVFSTPRDAVLAAVEGQQALLAHEWPTGVQIKVRMGLHTGQAVAAEGRYTGLAVHRSARIAAAAHGGQVLVSQATQTLLEDEEEDLHIFLRDLGEQRLKDLDRPVRVFQAEAEGLPASFPPLRQTADLAQAATATLVPPWWRRPTLLASMAIVLALAAGVALFVTTRGGGGGLGAVANNHVGVIDPATNNIKAQVPVGIRPGPIAVGAGSLWVGNLDDKSLTKIAARERATSATVSLENRTPTGIAFGNGAVWAAHGLSGQLSRVDGQFNRVTRTIEVSAPATFVGRGAVTVGAGFVWAVYADSTLARVDPTTEEAVAERVAGADPAAVIVAHGDVWVVNSGDATVYRFNPETFQQGPIKAITVGRRPLGITSGGGYLWVANAGEDAVTRIDPSTNATFTIRVDDDPVAIAFGAGAVWVANAASRIVSRIDPAKEAVTETIEIGSAPAGIAFADGAVWVSAQAP